MTTTDPVLASLHAAVCANPEDLEVRQVLADYLEEIGDTERAEFIRVQIELAKPFIEPDDVRLLCRRERVLLDDFKLDMWQAFASWAPSNWTMTAHAHEMKFRVGVKEWTQDIWCWIRRGFPEEVECSESNWLAHGPAIVRAHPIRRVVLTDKEPQETEFLEEISFDWWTHAEGPDHAGVPWVLGHNDLWKALVMRRFPTRQAALDALSSVAIKWARRKAGMEEVK